MPINFTTIKTNYIPNSTPPIQGSPVSIPNQTGANQLGTNTAFNSIFDQIDINITPTGGLANNHYSTASVDERVYKPSIDVVPSNQTNLVAQTFGPGGGFLGYTLTQFSKTFLLPNAFLEFEIQAPYWFYLNASPTPKFEIRIFRATNPSFSGAIQVSQIYTDFLQPSAGNQGRDKLLKFRDATIKTSGTYYYSIGVYPLASFGSFGGNFSGDLYCADVVTKLETKYNTVTTNL